MPRPSPFHLLLAKLPGPLKNKYFLVLTIFLLLLFFVDKHNLWTQWQLKNSVNGLEHDKKYYEAEIEKAKADKQNIEQNKEQFAREKYHMHKDKEEVFIIPDEKD